MRAFPPEDTIKKLSCFLKAFLFFFEYLKKIARKKFFNDPIYSDPRFLDDPIRIRIILLIRNPKIFHDPIRNF